MSVNKKILSVAIFGALVSGNAFAANLSATGGAIPAYFAKEIIATPAAPATLTTSAAGATLDWDIGYNFSDGEVRYARVECSDNIEFDAATAVTSTAATANIGSINGLGSNVLTFSVTSTAPNVVAADTFTVTGDHDITGTDFDVTCSVALYDQPSQAQAGGAAGRIANTLFSGAYLSFAPSYRLIAGNSTNTADVESVPSFSNFITSANSSLSDVWVGYNGTTNITFGLRDPDGTTGAQTATFGVNGLPVTLATLLAPTTSISVVGDLSLLASAGATPYNAAAIARTNLAGFAPTALSASAASYPVGNAGFNSVLVLSRRAGNLIQASDYVATLNAVSAAPTVYQVSNISGVRLGEIVRNGTELQAPLAQVPNGWLSRMVLTNTGSTARPYAIKVTGETGNTITLDASKLTGTVPANGTTVLDLDTLLIGFTGSPRATLNVTVAGPNKQIQGLYQIVNPTSGSISNHVMVRPGTN